MPHTLDISIAPDPVIERASAIKRIIGSSKLNVAANFPSQPKEEAKYTPCTPGANASQRKRSAVRSGKSICIAL